MSFVWAKHELSSCLVLTGPSSWPGGVGNTEVSMTIPVLKELQSSRGWDVLDCELLEGRKSVWFSCPVTRTRPSYVVLSVCGADRTGMRPSAAHRASMARRSKSSGQPTGRAGKEAEEDSRADFSRCRRRPSWRRRGVSLATVWERDGKTLAVTQGALNATLEASN